jgi:hypothetical protein
VHTVDFGSFGSSGFSVPGDDPGLELLPGGVERRGFVEDERDRLEGFRSTVGDSGDLAAGEGGLLPINTSWVGGIGVLDGRWARSKGMEGNCLMGIGTGIGSEAPFGTSSRTGCCNVLGPCSLSVTLRFSISSSSSIVGKYCWNSDIFPELKGDAGVIFGESDVEDTGDGGPKLEAGMSVCGVGAMGVGTGCVGVITEVWRDSRLKGLAGIGETGNDGNVACGNEDEDDASCVVTLVPFVASRGTSFVEATDSPAFCNEAILPAIDVGPEELREGNFVRMYSSADLGVCLLRGRGDSRALEFLKLGFDMLCFRDNVISVALLP